MSTAARNSAQTNQSAGVAERRWNSISRQLVGFNLLDHRPAVIPAVIAELGFGLCCTIAMILIRMPLGLVAPMAGPFALIYPAILASTLFGRWRSGLTTYVTAFTWVWAFILLDPRTGHLAVSGDGPTFLVNMATVLVVLVFAEIFRNAVHTACAQRDLEIARRDLALREIDHRTKNNFMMVESLLELQRRRETSISAQAALVTAASRIHSFSACHASLYCDGMDHEEISMSEYLHALTTHVMTALFLPGGVELRLKTDDMRMPRDQAVSIGLILNEIITNAAKHAFDPEATGLIAIEFKAESASWRLAVTDDGRGIPDTRRPAGLGFRLIESFAARAGGVISAERLERGTRIMLIGARFPHARPQRQLSSGPA